MPLTKSQVPQSPVAAFVPQQEEIETVVVTPQSWTLDTSEVDDSTKPIPTQNDLF
jgi:hypothetical protein